MRSKAKINVPFQVEWRVGHEVSPAFKEPANVRLGRQSFSEHNKGKWMEVHFEFRHHSEVTAAPAEAPK
jgi:hypothetical protein